MKQITTFYLDDCLWGIENASVDVILPLTTIIAIPQRNEQLFKGTMAHQNGRPIHIINTSRLLGVEAQPQSEETRVIVLRAKTLLIGLVVDSVSEVMNVADDEITKQLPLSKIENGYLGGIISSRGDKVVVLLDIEAVLSVLNP